MEIVDDMQADEQSSLHLCMHYSFTYSRAQTPLYHEGKQSGEQS